MEKYKIKRTEYGLDEAMVIVRNGEKLAEYQLPVGEREKQEVIASMRRALDDHLEGGGTLENFNF